MAYVLIVDDYLDSVESLTKFLERQGHQVVCAPNGRDALARLVDSKLPDVIFLDLHMPEMDGVTFLQIVRSYLRWGTIPIYLITALPEDGPEVTRAKLYHPQGIFLKASMHLDDVVRAVEAHAA